ncbi:MAG: penicillin-binding protein activator [Porticoccaceae bacterium]|nr:penicillin-binding protein activator [Porticoccaceae bacterium]
MPFKLLTKYFLLTLAAALLAACAGPSHQAPQAYTKQESLTQKAEQTLRSARQSSGPDQALHLLNAVRYYQQLNQPDQAAKLLEELDSSLLSPKALARFTVLYTPILLDKHEHFRAREQLTNPRLLTALDTLPMPLQIELRRQRGDLFSLLGEDKIAVAEFVLLSRLLSDPAAIKVTHNKIWKILSHTPDNTLRNLATEVPSMELKGWYQLALSTRSLSDISLQQGQIERWRRQWPAHPAIAFPPSELNAIANAATSAPSNLALLVPLTGNYGEAGTVIRNGFLATYYDNLSKGGRAPLVRVYDTSTQSITDVYQQAITEGANIVIGPLRKENLAALSMLNTLPVPVIGLNYLDDSLDDKLDDKLDHISKDRLDKPLGEPLNKSIGDSIGQPANNQTDPSPNIATNSSSNTATNVHHNLYQFGLSIADEAEQVAERAWLEGRRSALVMTPATGWGKRALAAFSKRWTSRGGKLVTTTPYSLRQSDFTGIIKPALLVDHSEQRAKKLQRTLGKGLEYSPRRRHDIDMIFLVAQPAQGRSIKPTLDFYYAHDLPVYATSHIYAGTESTDMNRDLEGIRFSAMPWTLPGMVPEHLRPDNNLRPTYRHLYTLGIDAYLMHQHVGLMKAAPQTQLFGHTGTLTLVSGNKIKRTQPWAEFKGNKVRPAPQMRED